MCQVLGQRSIRAIIKLKIYFTFNGISIPILHDTQFFYLLNKIFNKDIIKPVPVQNFNNSKIKLSIGLLFAIIIIFLLYVYNNY